MNEIQKFDFNGSKVRGVLIENTPWLVGKGQKYFVNKFLKMKEIA